MNPGELVVTTLVCFFILHARLRVHWAPGIPHALWVQELFYSSDASRREIADVRLKKLVGRVSPTGPRERGAMTGSGVTRRSNEVGPNT